MSIKANLIQKATDIVENSTDAKELALASAIVKNISESDGLVDDSIYTIGTQGEIGFGVGAIRDYQMPVGFTKLDGHDNPLSKNYANILDPNGSVMVAIPKCYFKWETNNLYISSIPKSGYALFRAFIDGGVEKDYILVDKYTCGNVGGKFISKQGIDPCSTHADHNPINALINTPNNNYGGLYKAVKTRGENFALTSKFIYTLLAMLSFAQGKSATNTSACAYSDVAPYMPKGNLVNALKDVNDASVTFTSSGYSNCALTGSGVPFAKTTHNGQACGIADLNGNMWEVASGFTKLNDTDGIFKILKENVALSSIQDDSNTDGNAYDATIYDDIDLSAEVPNANAWIDFGNGANAVFAHNTSRTSNEYKKTALGIPTATGVSAAGTTEFGQDGLYQTWRNEMACRCGGGWGYSSGAGVFAMYLSGYRTGSSGYAGGRACAFV